MVPKKVVLCGTEATVHLAKGNHVYIEAKNNFIYLSLLQLKTKAQLNKFVQLIGLPKKNGETPANVKCSVAGWGMLASDTATSDVLMEASVQTGRNSDCKQVWKKDFKPSQMMCTLTDKGKGFCQVSVKSVSVSWSVSTSLFKVVR